MPIEMMHVKLIQNIKIVFKQYLKSEYQVYLN